MNTENLIPTREFCKFHQIEISFIDSLQEFGLIKTVVVQQDTFLTEEELPKIEQILIFNKDLDINLEGVEVIVRLLEKVNAIQDEMNTLKNRLHFYESL